MRTLNNEHVARLPLATSGQYVERDDKLPGFFVVARREGTANLVAVFMSVVYRYVQDSGLQRDLPDFRLDRPCLRGPNGAKDEFTRP